MVTLKEAAENYEPKKNTCIECGKKLKDYRAVVCRMCWKMYNKKNFQLNPPLKEKNINWKGDKVGYRALHYWVIRNKPKPSYCEICKKNPPQQVANISGKYNRDINDFQWLCVKCHVVKDGTINNLNYNRTKKEVKTKWNKLRSQ